jgi:hypothetical protein
MAGSATSLSAADRPRRKRQFPFGLVMLAFGLGLGFYGGVAATKRAMSSPTWVQRIFGISSIVVPAPAQQPTVTTPLPPSAPTAPAPVVPPAAPPVSIGTGTDGMNPAEPDPTVKPDKPAKKRTADSRDLVGSWSVTDSLASDSAAASTVISTYVFHGDGTGEFDSNGRKLYDFHWKPYGEDISVDFEGEGPDPNQPWNAKLGWSLNDDHTVLTLIPTSGKDARGFVYSLGPGVYHRKP